MKTKSAVNRAGTAVNTDMRVDTQVYAAGLSVVGVFACAVVLWAAASLIGGMIASGGPLALLADWFSAVFSTL